MIERLQQVILWLFQGSDEQYMSYDWMTRHLPAHEAYTESQLVPGMARVHSDTAAMERREFWRRIEAKNQRPLPDNVRQMRKR